MQDDPISAPLPPGTGCHGKNNSTNLYYSMSELKGKTHEENLPAGMPGSADAGVMRRAAGFALGGFALGALAQVAVVSRLPEGGPVRILVDILPLQLGAFGAVCLSFGTESTNRGIRALAELDGGPRSAFGPALRTMLWLYPTIFLVSLLSFRVLHWAGIPPAENTLLRTLAQQRNVFSWGVIALVVVVLAPVSEEVLFRRVLHDALEAFDVAGAAWWTALAFALVHAQPGQLVSLFVLSLALQRLRARQGNLWSAVLLHALVNGISLIILALTPG